MASNNKPLNLLLIDVVGEISIDTCLIFFLNFDSFIRGHQIYQHIWTPQGCTECTSRVAFEVLVINYQKDFMNLFIFNFFFSIWVSLHDHSRITGQQGKGEDISWTPHYHFHPLHRHLDISQVIIVESSPLHIGSSRTRTGNLWFPSASR